MSRSHTVLLEALLAIAVTIGAHPAAPVAHTPTAACGVASAPTWRGGGSVRRTPSPTGWPRPTKPRSTVAEAGCAGVPFRSPSSPLGRVAFTLSTGARARTGGADLAVAAGVGTAPRPTTPRNGNVNEGGLARTRGHGMPCQSGDTRPHWLGRPAGLASKAPVSGVRSGACWGHPADLARTVRFPDKWDDALLAIAKGLMQ